MNEIVKRDMTTVPSFIDPSKYKDAKLGNLDKSDKLTPRLKLVQSLSDEVALHDTAKPGCFWLTEVDVSLGPVVRIIPVACRKTYVLWAPRGDDRGRLAVSNDAIHWVPPNAEFQVKPKGSSKMVTWRTAPTVKESGLHLFGTSNPDDPNSNPAAQLTYNWVLLFPDYPEVVKAIVLNTRSAVKRSKKLSDKVDFVHDQTGVPPWGQEYLLTASRDEGSEGPYYNYSYAPNGFVDNQELFERGEALNKEFWETEWKFDDTPEYSIPFEPETVPPRNGRSRKY